MSPLPGEASIVVETATPRATETDAERLKREADEKVLALLRLRLRTADSGESHFRTQAILDMKHRVGTWGDEKSFQWHEGVEQARKLQNRPCITVNKAPGFVRQVTNQARAAHLRIQVSPVDDKGDPKLAEVLQGMIRNIETTSFADRAYAMGSDKQAEQGRGYIRLLIEWADPFSGKGGAGAFRQRVKIKREKNPLAIYVDLTATEADYSDAEWALKVTDLDNAVFEEQTGYPAPTPGALALFEGTGDQTGDWFPNGKTRIVEYFSREARGPKRHIALLSDGTVIDYPTPEQMDELKTLNVSILMNRKVQKKVMVWRKCDALRVHEESIWPADAQPWIPVIADEYEVDGEKDFRGVIRDSKSSAMLYNVQVSALMENVALGQKAPVIGVRGQFGAPDSKMRKAWETANQKPVAFLEYEQIDIDGKPAPAPTRVEFETNVQGIVIALEQTNEDYKSTAGFRDASLGERGPQESGKAILARQKQDELGSSHYLDNLRFALCALGRQMIQLIRAVYDAPTVIRITGKDEKPRKVLVFSGAERDPRRNEFLQKDPATGQVIPYQLPEGVSDIYDLSIGEFDIEVSASPDSGTRRQEAVEAMSALFQRLPPEVAMKFLDLYFLVMDFPMGRQMADRAKKLLPEGFGDEDDSQQQIPPQVQAQMAQMKQELQTMAAAGQQLQKELDTEQAKLRAQYQIKALDLDTQRQMNADKLRMQERIEQMKMRAKLIEQQIEIKAERALLLLDAELDHLRSQTEHQQDLTTAGLEQQHAIEGQLIEHQHSTEAQDTDHQHSLQHADLAHAEKVEDRKAEAAAAAKKPAGGAAA